MNDTEIRKQFGAQLTKYLGGKERVKEMVKQCRNVGLDLGDIQVIKNIAEKPEFFTVLLNYNELGLLKRLGQAIEQIKTNTKEQQHD